MNFAEKKKERFGLIGTITWDTIQLSSGQKWQAPGGILYQAACLSALGAEVTLFSNVGLEVWPKVKRIINFWPRVKIDGLKIFEGPGNQVYLYYPERGERRERLKWLLPPLTLSQILPFLREIDFLITVFNSGFDLDFYSWLQIIQSCSCPIWLDIHSLVLSPNLGLRKYESFESWPGWVEGVDYLQVNEKEAACMLGRPNQKLSLEDFHNLSDQALALGLKAMFITLGKRGVFVATQERREILEPKEKLRVVDTTGCGDCFAAATCLKLFQGKSVFEAAQLGLFVASQVVKVKGVSSTYKLLSKINVHWSD